MKKASQVFQDREERPQLLLVRTIEGVIRHRQYIEDTRKGVVNSLKLDATAVFLSALLFLGFVTFYCRPWIPAESNELSL